MKAAEGVPVAGTVVSKGDVTASADPNDAELQARLQQNDTSLRKAAFGDVDGPPQAKLVEVNEPLPDHKGFDPYGKTAPPAWEQIKPNGKNKGGLQTCIVS